MSIVRGIVAILFLAALIGAGVVISHSGGRVAQAGSVVGYTPPARGQRLLVIGDSFSISADSTQDNWVKLFTDATQMKPTASVIANTGYLNGAGGKTFLDRILQIRGEQKFSSASSSTSVGVAATTAPPNWAVIWGAWDDFRDIAAERGKAFIAFQNDLARSVRKTITAAKTLVPRGHLIVVGPADGPQINERQARALDGTEHFVASRLGVSYISPVTEHWFTTDPSNNQDNRGFISINNTPTDQGQVHILAEFENALAALPHVSLGQGGQRATDPVPPVLPTTTAAPVTRVSVATVTRTSIARATRTISEPPITVTPPPVVVTVTVPASP